MNGQDATPTGPFARLAHRYLDDIRVALMKFTLPARFHAPHETNRIWDDWPRAERAELIEEFVLPKSVLHGLRNLEAERKKLRALQDTASSRSRKLARALLKRGVGLCDAGDLLSLSHQRVAQLVSDEAN